jgi:carboxyl-terminal processing protease
LGRSIQKSYEDGIDKYKDEVLERYHNGDLSRQDSSNAPKGKAFVTAGGKKLYGGGGISPDIFIPIETNMPDTVLTAMYSRNTIGVFAYRYYVGHRALFDKYKNAGDFNKSFQVDDSVLDELMAYAKKDSVMAGNITASMREKLKLSLKGLLARQQWRTEGYFTVVNTADEMVGKALEFLKK